MPQSIREPARIPRPPAFSSDPAEAWLQKINGFLAQDKPRRLFEQRFPKVNRKFICIFNLTSGSLEGLELQNKRYGDAGFSRSFFQQNLEAFAAVEQLQHVEQTLSILQATESIDHAVLSPILSWKFKNNVSEFNYYISLDDSDPMQNWLRIFKLSDHFDAYRRIIEYPFVRELRSHRSSPSLVGISTADPARIKLYFDLPPGGKLHECLKSHDVDLSARLEKILGWADQQQQTIKGLGIEYGKNKKPSLRLYLVNQSRKEMKSLFTSYEDHQIIENILSHGGYLYMYQMPLESTEAAALDNRVYLML